MRVADADPWDVALGSVVRRRRRLLKLSQSDLGQAVGVTFQQVQKYEIGANRISFSALVRICRSLDCTPTQVIKDLTPPEPVNWDDEPEIAPEQRELIEAFSEIKSDRIRQAVLDMVRKMAGED